MEGVVWEAGDESKDGEDPVGHDGQGKGGVGFDVRIYGIETERFTAFKGEGRVVLSRKRRIEVPDGAFVKKAFDVGFSEVAVGACLDGIARPIQNGLNTISAFPECVGGDGVRDEDREEERLSHVVGKWIR